MGLEKDKLDFIIDEYGVKYEVERELGRGGQGIVLKLRNKNLVAKIKTDKMHNIIKSSKKYKEFRNDILNISSLQLPNNIKIVKPLRFWQEPYCGYIMQLMDNMIPLSDILIPYEKENSMTFYKYTGSLIRRLRILKNLAETLETLRSLSIVYADLSPNNIYISEEVNENEVWLIDPDNMRYLIDFQNTLGTPPYMAPEIAKYLLNKNNYMAPEVSSCIRTNDVFSDNYSFALIAFQLLSFCQPFIGKAVLGNNKDEDFGNPRKKAACGELPWILDKNDTSNAFEITDFPKDFEYCPENIMALFHKVFSEEGRTTPNTRPKMIDWYGELSRAINSLYICECGHSYSYKNTSCPFCNTPRPKIYIVISSSVYNSEIAMQYNPSLTPEIRKKMNNDISKKTEKARVLNNLSRIKDDEDINIINYDDIFYKFLEPEEVLFTVRRETDDKYYVIKKSENIILKYLSNDSKLVEFELNKKYKLETLDNKYFIVYKKEDSIMCTRFKFKLI